MGSRPGWGLAILLGVCGPALAAEPPVPVPVPVPMPMPVPVPVRVAVHGGFTRLVFDFPRPTTMRFQRHGADVVLGFSTPGSLVPPPGFDAGRLHNLRGAAFGQGMVTLALAPGVTVRSYGLGDRRVIDLFDPTPVRSSADAPRAIAPMNVAELPGRSAAVLDVGAVLSTGGETLPPVRQTDGIPERPARAALDVPDGPGAGAILAFPAGTGAAAITRGGVAEIVFDQPREIDPASLRARPGFANATVQQLADAVLIRVALPAGAAVGLARSGMEWSMDVLGTAARPALADLTGVAEPAPARMHVRAAAAGRVVVVPDPATGENLLVGTLTDANAAVHADQQFPQFALLPSAVGVFVDPVSDRVAMRAVADGFVVESAVLGGELALAVPREAPPAVARLSRSFDLPDQPVPALRRLLAVQIADAAAAPVLARLPYRLAVAQTMLALGLGPEAQGVLRIAAADDPRALSDDRAQALAGAAALVAGRLDQLGGLEAATPSETAEHRLWRGLGEAARLPDGKVPDAECARAVADGVDLLISYPPTLQRALLPLAADTLLRGGALEAADRLLGALADAPDLALARAAALQAHGQNDAALAAYDHLTQQPDRSVRARAAIAALDLRDQLGRIPPAAAADAGERLLYAWRGDTRERDLWLRIADWRKRAGQYRQQLATLREALEVFPQAGDGIQAKLTQAFGDMLNMPTGKGVDRLAPLDLVSLVQDNMDLLPAGPEATTMLDRLADRLAALDLPEQAEAVLTKLIGGAGGPAIRAAWGARLAALDMGEGDANAALEALQHSAAPDTDVSGDLVAQRNVLAAQANAALGNGPAALAALGSTLDAPVVLERARVNVQAHDWRGAAAELSAYASNSLPAAGKLNDSQAGVVLQLASALAQTRDEPGLAKLRAEFGGRLADGNDGTLFTVLTEPPVTSVADLKRAATETETARALPAALRQPPGTD